MLETTLPHRTVFGQARQTITPGRTVLEQSNIRHLEDPLKLSQIFEVLERRTIKPRGSKKAERRNLVPVWNGCSDLDVGSR